MIPNDQVDEVRARADIVQIIGEYVQLSKSGREFKAKCPFHQERTASFYVVPDRGFFNCFGCGKSGDVFDFVRERLGLDFVGAVKHVAGRSGVEIREVTRMRDEEDPNRPLYELNAFAKDWFRKCLEDPEAGEVARRYLEGRGIGLETAERFGLGYAPDEWRAFRDAAATHGLSEDLMLEVGLLAESDRAKEPYDRFRGRIMFPIETLSGRVTAFGGRTLADSGTGQPKYLNSPESSIYHKGSTLYGLSWAANAIRREQSAMVVEGYMDVVSLAAHGFENVVAPLGTAMTTEQAKLLGRYSKRIVLLFDSDRAGMKATFKAGDILLEAGLHPMVATLPAGEDPDTIVRSLGPDALSELLDDAVDVLDRKLQILDEKRYFATIEGIRDAVDRLLPTLRAAADPALHDIYVSKVAERTGVRRETLEADISRAQAGAVRQSPPPGPASRGPAPRQRVPKLGAERTLLLIMTKNPRFVERAGEQLGVEAFLDSHHRTIFEALLAEPELRAPPSAMDPVAAQRFQEILSDPEEIAHASRVFDEAVARIRVGVLDRRSQELDRLIQEATGEAEKRDLIEEKIRISRERRELFPDDWTTTARKLRTDPNQ